MTTKRAVSTERMSSIGLLSEPFGYCDGLNYYRAMANNPINRVDHSGTQAWHLKGLMGDWDVDLRMDIAVPGLPFYVVQAEIVFKPNMLRVTCDNIELIQIARTTRPNSNVVFPEPPNLLKQQERQTSDGWALDRKAGVASPWFQRDNKGNLDHGASAGASGVGYYSVAVMNDSPSWNVEADWYFEVVAASTKTGEIFGSLRWGFNARLDDFRQWTAKFHEPVATDMPSNDFFLAVAKWNEQARGPAEKRNDPNQIPLIFENWGQVITT